MPGRPTQTPPKDWTAPGSAWPDGPLTASAPPEAEYARQFVLNLTEAANLQGLGDREIARALRQPRTPIMRVLRGEGMPSFTMVVHLEERLGADLYPGGPALRARIERDG